MVEAVADAEVGFEAYGITFDDPPISDVEEAKMSEWTRVSELYQNTPKSELSLPFPLEDNTNYFLNAIKLGIRDDDLAVMIFETLVEHGLDGYDRHLGSGWFGNVFLVQGSGKFEGQSLALKLIPQVSNGTVWHQEYLARRELMSTETLETLFPSSDFSEVSFDCNRPTLSFDRIYSRSSSRQYTETLESSGSSSLDVFNTIGHYSGTWSISLVTEEGVLGDGLALSFPKEGSLSAAYGLLLFDGERVEYVESIDLEKHVGWVVVGVVSLAASGGNLSQRVHTLPPGAEEVRGYGKSLAEAIHELHGYGYAHRDVHMGNVLLLQGEENPSFELQLTDFGLTRNIEEAGALCDWKCFGHCLSVMVDLSPDPIDPDLEDLLYQEEKGLLTVGKAYTEEEILNHPYFA